MEIAKPKKKKNNLRNILFAIVSVLVVCVLFHKYQVHKKYENISRFDALPNDSIDLGFYDQEQLGEYYQNCRQLTDMAKVLWLKNGIDIHKDTAGFGEIQSKMNTYKSLFKLNQTLEAHLKESKELKEQGLSNDEIAEILNKGLTIGAYQIEKDKSAAFEFLKGKNVNRTSSPPDQIWEMQKLLNANEYIIPIDGIFNSITDSALVDFQKKSGLFPSHVCNDVTLIHLAK